MSNVPQKAQPDKPKRTRPDISEAMSVQADPGDNRKYLLHNMAVNALADTHVEMTDEQAVAERITAYFQICAENDMKPSVAGFALAFGVSRKCLWEWVTGQRQKGFMSDNVRKLLERAYNVLNAQMEDYMQNGKINPVAGIFLMKNNMGYEDKKEITVAPGATLGEDVPAEDLRRKYLEAVETDGAERAESE